MGMFDYVICEVPLPDGYVPPDGGFQSKDLDCDLDTYVIRADGRLTKALDFDDGDRRKPSEFRDSDFHGWFNFYDFGKVGVGASTAIYPNGEPIREWHEYRAKFTDGRLVKIEIVEDLRPSPSHPMLAERG
jgi:hypothetical protein